MLWGHFIERALFQLKTKFCPMKTWLMPSSTLSPLSDGFRQRFDKIGLNAMYSINCMNSSTGITLEWTILAAKAWSKTQVSNNLLLHHLQIISIFNAKVPFIVYWQNPAVKIKEKNLHVVIIIESSLYIFGNCPIVTL